MSLCSAHGRIHLPRCPSHRHLFPFLLKAVYPRVLVVNSDFGEFIVLGLFHVTPFLQHQAPVRSSQVLLRLGYCAPCCACNSRCHAWFEPFTVLPRTFFA